mmetsp:Transcript_55950/g.122878  ORF Transcript_55950/g.122878 Transcript_55950/m.122878 type:complete len:393 (+) Transcript_55950:60-1238(+)
MRRCIEGQQHTCAVRGCAHVPQHGLGLILLRARRVQQPCRTGLALSQPALIPVEYHQEFQGLHHLSRDTNTPGDSGVPSATLASRLCFQHLAVISCCLPPVPEILMQTSEARQCHSLAVAAPVRLLIALKGLGLSVHEVVALRHGAPHPRILGAQGHGTPVVEEGIEVKIQELVGLAKAVPGSVVPWVDVNGRAIGVDCGGRILHLHELMAHEDPCRSEVAIEAERALEVRHRPLVLALQAVVVPDDATRLGGVLVHPDGLASKVAQRRRLLLDVQDVGVRVQGCQLVRIAPSDLVERLLGLLEASHVVVACCNLRRDVGRVWEESPQAAIQIQSLCIVLQLQVVGGLEKPSHPVVRQMQLSTYVGHITEVRAEGDEVEPSGPMAGECAHSL